MSAESWAGSSREEGQHAGSVGADAPGDGAPGQRREIGSRADNQRHPPHVTENAEDAPVQDESIGGPIPVVPPNASGRDAVPADELAQPIDPESGYDRRPAEDKDRGPRG